MQNHQYVPVCMCVYAQSCLVGTPWTVARQAPLSMEFPREEYWSVLLAFPPWDLPLRDQTHISCVSCIDRQTVCHWCHLGNPNVPQFSSVQSLSRVWLFATPWIAARQASLSITNSQSSLKLMSIKSVIPSSHLILCCLFLLLPPIPPSIRVFSNESALRMGWPKYWSFS